MPARFPHFARRLCVLGLAALAVAAAPALAAISVTDDTGATVTFAAGSLIINAPGA